LGDPLALGDKALGFTATAAGWTALRKIQRYYQNIGLWLARAATQSQLFADAVYMLSRSQPLNMVKRPDRIYSSDEILEIGARDPNDIDIVIGIRGPVATPDMCNGLMIPLVAFDQIYSFTRPALIQAIPRPENITPVEFKPAAEEVFDRIIQMTDNAGGSDEHRALNYLAVRYPAIYSRAAESFARSCSLSGVEVRASSLNGLRKIADVIFSYTHRNTDFTEKFMVRVDVTEQFPFLVTKLAPYFDR
jgi:hypothetical protein